MEKALEYERERLVEIMEKEEAMVQETRRWDANEKKTFSMRTKDSPATANIRCANPKKGTIEKIKREIAKESLVF